jgi:hypothetical protein
MEIGTALAIHAIPIKTNPAAIIPRILIFFLPMLMFRFEPLMANSPKLVHSLNLSYNNPFICEENPVPI